MFRWGWISVAAALVCLVFASPLVIEGTELSRGDAATIIRDAVLPSLDLPPTYIAFLYPDVVAPSDRLAPYAPHPMTDRVDRLPHLIPYDSDRPVWFCWIDLEPHSRFAHPTLFVLVDAIDGSVAVHQEAWWPVLNEGSLWVEPNEYWSGEDWVASSFEPGMGMPEGGSDAVCLADQPGSDSYDWALVINGWSPGQPDRAAFAADAAGICRALGALGMRVSTLGPGESGPAALEAFVIRLFTEIPLYKCCDRLYFYFIAHATPGSLWIGGERLRAEELARILFMPGELYVPSRVYVFLESGFGGSFLPALAPTGNIFRVWTASAANEPASRDVDGPLDPNPGDAGGEWTSSFLAALGSLLQDDVLAIQATAFGREYMPVNMAFDQAGCLNSAVLGGVSHPAGYSAGDENPDELAAGIEYLARWDRAYHLIQGDLEQTVERYADSPCQELLWFLNNMARHDALPEPSREFNGRIGKGYAKDLAAANWWEYCDLFWEILTQP